MTRLLALAATAAVLVTGTALPAAASAPHYCFSFDLACYAYSCPVGSKESHRIVWEDTGPMLILCDPLI